MVTETLQVNILAKIRDFEKKMGVVEKKINTVDKGSKTANKTIDKMLSTKASGTNKSVDLVNKKLAQVNRTAASTKKALSGKMMFSADSSGIDLQKVKLDQLRQKYEDLTSGVRAPASLKTAEKDLAAVSQQLADADAKAAKLYVELQRLQTLQSGSRDIGNTKGVANYQIQIDAVQREMDVLAASTDIAGAKADSLNAKIQALRMNPSASPEAQLLAAQIKAADAKMEKLGTDTTKTTKKIAGIRGSGGALDAINRKLSNLERSSAKTARSVTALGRRFLVLFTGKLISMAFNGLQDGLTGASTKSDQLKSSLDTLTSAGRTISNAVVAALTPLINVAAPMIDYISQKIMDFGNSVAMFFASISGQSTVLQATKAYQAYGSAASSAGDSAAAGAEKAKNALAGFDQITKLDTSASSSGSGGGSSGTADNGTTSYTTVPVVQSELAKKVSDAIGNLKGPLSDFYETVLKPIGTWVMGPGVDFLATALTNVSSFVEEHPTLTGWLVGFVAALVALSLIGKIGVAINATLTGLGLLAPALLGTASSVPLGVIIGATVLVLYKAINDPSGTADVIDSTVAAIDGATGGWLTRTSNQIEGFFSSVGYDPNPPLEPVTQLQAANYQEMTGMSYPGKVMDENGKIIEKATRDQSRTYEDYLYNLAASTGKTYAQIKATVGAETKEEASIVKTGTRDQSRTYQDYLYGLTTKTGTAYETVKTTVDLGTKGAAKYLTTNTANGVNTAVGSYAGMPTSVQGYLTTLGDNVFGSSGATARALYDQTKLGVNNTIPLFSQLVNDSTLRMLRMADNSRLAILNILNNLGYIPTTTDHASVTSASTKVLGGKLASLPMYAQGGIVNSATAAIIGESGKEAVIPLERNTGWIDKLADKINSRGSSGEDIYLTVQTVLDGQVVAEKVTKIQKRDARRSNKPVFA